MTDRDQELDEILTPLRTSKPSDIELARWHAALAREKKQAFLGQKFLLLSVGIAAGLIAGFLIFKPTSSQEGPCGSIAAKDAGATSFDTNDATEEQIYAKLD